MNYPHVAIVFNPKGGSANRNKLERLINKLCVTGYGITVSLFETEATAKSARQKALTAYKEGADLVIAFGGDGTVGEVAEAAYASNKAMAAFPGGTGNLFAESFYSRNSPESFAQKILFSKPQQIDMVLIESINSNGTVEEQHLCLVGAVTGQIASAIGGSSSQLKQIFGRLVYIFRSLGIIVSPETERLIISSNSNGTVKTDSSLLLIQNTGLSKVPSLSQGCNASDGLVDVVNLNCQNVYEALSFIYWLCIGKPQRSSHYKCWRTNELDLIFQERPTVINIDGEGIRAKHLRLKVLPSSLQVVLA